jgi:hypothetical protein
LITWSASFLFIEMQKYWTTYKANRYWVMRLKLFHESDSK